MNPIYILISTGDGYYYARVLGTKSNKPAEISGYETVGEFDVAIKKQYGPDAARVSKRVFHEELERRAIHTPKMISLLKESYMGDLSAYHVYGSPMRPMSSVWARIEGAVYINADVSGTGYHTYVAVPAVLSQDMIDRYELEFVSHPMEKADE